MTTGRVILVIFTSVPMLTVIRPFYENFDPVY